MMCKYLARVALTTVLLAQGVALSGCANITRQAPERVLPTHVAPPTARIVQVGYGAAATFVVCSGSGCPAITRKTLADVPNVASAAAPTPRPDAADIASATADPHRAVVYFATDSAALDAAARRTLDELIPHIEQGIEVLIQGRTDSKGRPDYNVALAQRRAVAVKAYLEHVKPGVGDHVVVDARGACCYAASNKTPTGRAKNRRAVIRFAPHGTVRRRAKPPK